MSLYKNHGVMDDGIKRSHPFSLVAEDFDLCTFLCSASTGAERERERDGG